jgi:hypothetical protein
MLFRFTNTHDVTLVGANYGLLDSDGSLTFMNFIFVYESTESSALLIDNVHCTVHGNDSGTP